uniref:PstS family phosphate ABC transporter substrate-binding protein n=1 Tax=Daejeonella sp. TaxID=2805397 RepID=UPI0039832A70
MIGYVNLRSLICVGFIALLVSCQQRNEEIQSYTSGNEKILVDESLVPIIEDQTYVFESTYPDAKLVLIDKSENELINSFLDDSAQVAILSRELTNDERRHFDNKKIKVRVNRFAVDGIALIAHNSIKDSTVTVEDIIKVLKGQQSPLGNLVFDNANSSTVRYFKELAVVKELPAKGVYALKTNSEVIRYVHDNPGTIGVVGVNWIVQPPVDLEKQV